jgi:hypothetical protein
MKSLQGIEKGMSNHIKSDKKRRGVYQILHTLTMRFGEEKYLTIPLRMAGYHGTSAHKRIGNESVTSLLNWMNLPDMRNHETVH